MEVHAVRMIPARLRAYPLTEGGLMFGCAARTRHLPHIPSRELPGTQWSGLVSTGW
jgi:hypothetical protein